MDPSPTPIPTPYDITAIPVFAYIPGVLPWLLLSTLVVAVLAVFRYITAKRASLRYEKRAYLTVIEELDRILKYADVGEINLAHAEGITLMIKRLLSERLGRDLVSLTDAEIVDLMKAQSSAELREISVLLAEVDRKRYQGEENQHCPVTLLDRLKALIGSYYSAGQQHPQGRQS